MEILLQNKRKILTVVIILIALGGYVLSYYYYSQNKALKRSPDQVAQEQELKVTRQVAELMQLPTDETPNIVLVTDKSKLVDKLFFKNVENGDVLLMYSKNREAILYRPSINRIIQVGPIYDNNSKTQTQTQTTTTTASVTVALYNGSHVVGATQTVLEIIKSKLPVNVVQQTMASSTAYQSTLIVDVSGAHTSEAEQIANLLHATIASMPAGETKPSADILVIVGNK
jgi:hypothetical protein